MMKMPKLFWLYLRGLTSDQYDFNLDQKCPKCRKGFQVQATSDIHKIGTMPCNESHWYHRSCLKEIIESNREEGDAIQCGHCQVFHEYPIPDKVKYLKTLNEYTTAIAGEGLVVVDFTATWCPPCKMIGPKFVALDGKYENVTLVKVDVDANKEAAQAAGIESMPTFKFFKGGVEVH